MTGDPAPDTWKRLLDGMHRFGMQLHEMGERLEIEESFRKAERDAQKHRRSVASERAAVAVKFLDLRPDGRPTFDAAYLAVAQVIGMMGDCSRDHIGAVAVRQDVPLAWGYNGTNRGEPGCLAGACPRAAQDVPLGSDYHNCISRHAEINLIGYAAHHGIRLADATVYVSRQPCAGCTKALYAVDVARVIYPEELTTPEKA